MTVYEYPADTAAERDDEQAPLELLTDDGHTWTVVPEDAADIERMTQWISVDRSTLCELEAMR
ncbi:hypothetical protein OB919_02565 [Halobacteria archaeon AArc-curdl1]|uniref:DUF7511 domain-containing protein n=1 Tax=Natronosalvus hydrolyticus TaxID=2979988 RepID=A0AAP2Z647_9EURY|nr:hypothetical protein [Halobacteria archaeon AArc-curdl1]